MQSGSSLEIVLVKALNDTDWVPSQERGKLINLYRANLKLMDTDWNYFENEYLSSWREKQHTQYEDSKNE